MPSIRSFAAALVASAAFSAQAANLVIGLSADVTSIDPHYHNLTPNNAVALHLFDTLVLRSEKSQPMPGLATEWKPVEPYKLATEHYVIPVDEFAEVELPGLRVLNRAELRGICNQAKTRAAIIEALTRP